MPSRRSWKRKCLLCAMLLLPAILVIGWIVTRDPQWLVSHEHQLRTYVNAYRLRAAFVGFLFYVAASFIPGTSGKSILFGWLFGFWIGLVIVNVALTLAAIGSLLFSRYWLRDRVQKRFARQLQAINDAFVRDGSFYLLVLRVIHVPYSLVNYTMGATAVDVRTFWWTTQLGLLPGNAVLVYAGSRLPTLQQVIATKGGDILTADLLAALVIMSVFPFLIRSIIRRLWPEVEEEAEEVV